MNRVEALHGELNLPGEQGVGISLGFGREAGMKVMGYFATVQNADGTWEQAIEPSDEGRAGNGRFGVKIGDHCLGMNSRVCSTGAVQRDWMSTYDLEAPFNFPLDGDGIFLSLPTTIIGAIVGDGEFYVAHGRYNAFLLVEGVKDIPARCLSFMEKKALTLVRRFR